MVVLYMSFITFGAMALGEGNGMLIGHDGSIDGLFIWMWSSTTDGWVVVPLQRALHISRIL